MHSTSQPARPQSRFPRVFAASLLDTVSVLAGVSIPTIAERLQDDRHAIRVMQRLRRRYGAGPVTLRIPGRRIAMLLDPDDVHRVLDESPEPFALDVGEKRGALAFRAEECAHLARRGSGGPPSL